TEQAVIGRMGGAERVPETVAELDEYADRMRPLMAVNAQTQSFLDFLAGKTGDEHEASGREQFERRLALRASLSLMPEWARRLTGFHHADVVQRAVIDPYNALHGAAVRWAFP